MYEISKLAVPFQGPCIERYADKVGVIIATNRSPGNTPTILITIERHHMQGPTNIVCAKNEIAF